MIMEKRGRGRPKYTTLQALVHRGKVPATWKEDIIALGERGRNKLHFANYLKMSRDTLYKLIDRDKDFADTIKLALELSQQWWIDKGIEAFEEGKSKNLNGVFWKYYMENVYRKDWRPAEQSIDITSGGEKITDNKIIVDIIPPKVIEPDEDTSN
jgi:hypothetical protein